jgi:multidrug efflux system outer membrane protein
LNEPRPRSTFCNRTVPAGKLRVFLRIGIARPNEFPQVSLHPNFSGGKTDQNIKSNVFSLAADVVFQVDLFGRYRRETESAQTQLLGTQDAQQT